MIAAVRLIYTCLLGSCLMRGAIRIPAGREKGPVVTQIPRLTSRWVSRGAHRSKFGPAPRQPLGLTEPPLGSEITGRQEDHQWLSPGARIVGQSRIDVQLLVLDVAKLYSPYLPSPYRIPS